MNRITVILTIGLVMAVGSGCSTLKSWFAVNNANSKSHAPIHNPFDTYYAGMDKKDIITLRTKKGDRSVEVELPASGPEISEFMIPVSPAFRDGRSPASVGDAGMGDERYRERSPGVTDREIISQMPQASPDNDGKRREVETGLGVMHSEDVSSSDDKSYLAQLDHVKQLFKYSRYEAALLELDDMLRSYPTDPRLYEMRGTLLERTGRMDLAVKSWNQALRLDPQNHPLRKYVERKQQKRSVASP